MGKNLGSGLYDLMGVIGAKYKQPKFNSITSIR
jgi:hypothetical protein